MADIFTPAERSAVMARIRSRGNRDTELRLIALLRVSRITGWRRGSKLVGRPDFFFPRIKVAVFVDGDFWHGHPTRSRIPATRPEFWRAKIEANKSRDRLVTRTLRSNGWTVLRIWEFALTRRHQHRTMARLARAIAKASAGVHEQPSSDKSAQYGAITRTRA